MDKEKDFAPPDIEADFTGYSEEELDKAVDIQPGPISKASSGTIFSPANKKALRKKKVILVEYTH